MCHDYAREFSDWEELIRVATEATENGDEQLAERDVAPPPIETTDIGEPELGQFELAEPELD